MTGRHAGEVGYHDDDERDRAVVYLGGAIHSVPSAHLASVTTLEHERGKRAHAEFCR